MKPQESPVFHFFQSYERVLQSGDLSGLKEIYHSSFLFGGPGGAQAVALEDFLKVVPRRSALTQALGLTGTRLVSVEPTPLDERYTLAKVGWEMTVQRPGKPVLLWATPATYVLLAGEEGFRIVAQIDHQDLLAEWKALETS